MLSGQVWCWRIVQISRRRKTLAAFRLNDAVLKQACGFASKKIQNGIVKINDNKSCFSG